ncbi:MAG: beta-ketoacyl synthase N-terminal-like domain-containing protein [Chloroflexota bacterium]
MLLRKHRLGRGAAVIGAGVTKFGIYPEGVSATDLFLEAFADMRGSVDKGFNHGDIKALYLGNFSSDIFENQVHTAASVISRLGLAPRPATRVEDACASSGVAFREGVIAIASGIYDMVLVGGMEKMTGLTTSEVTGTLGLALDPVIEAPAGLTFPGIFAAMAVAHMAKYGTTSQDLMRVTIKNHHHAALNPKAHLDLSVGEMMKKRTASLARKGLPAPDWADEIAFLSDPVQNPVIAWPLRLFDCSTVCDGASCVLLVAEDLAREFTDKPVYVIGTGQASDHPLHERADMTSMGATKEASKQAYEMAGISPNDIDIAELHDCFTIAEIMAMEDLGFYPAGGAVRALRAGETGRDGRLPVNTDGGLKAKGHPVGASGTGMVVELFKQMRGTAGMRQAKSHDLELGLMQNIGANGTTAVVNIFQRR